MIGDEGDSGFDSLAVAGGDDFDLDSVAKTLIKDLQLGESEWGQEPVSLEKALRGLDSLSPHNFRNVALDVSVVCGLSGDWILALKLVSRLLTDNDDRVEVKIWELRCLVECGRYAEALALAQTVHWERSRLIHVNYLTGVAFDALGMKQQAQLRFEAVRSRDPNYRDVQFK